MGDLFNPLNVAAALAVVMPILAKLPQVTIVTSKNVQAWIVGIAAATILIPAYQQGLLTSANAAELGAKVVLMIGLNVFLYEYVVKNLVKLYVWAKAKYQK